MLRETEHEESLKYVTEVDTYKMLKKYSKKSLGPNDLPQKILQEFAAELATPFCDIINCTLRSGTFPDAYKQGRVPSGGMDICVNQLTWHIE